MGTFSPYIAKHKRASTANSYEDLFSRHIEPKLGQSPLNEITTADCSRLLTGLAETLGRNSLNHVRSTLSAVFTHALNLGGIIERNPVSGCKVLANVKAPGSTEFYTEEEIQKIIEKLEGMPDCQAIMGLSSLLRAPHERDQRDAALTRLASWILNKASLLNFAISGV